MDVPNVIDPEGWMSTTDVAQLMEVPVGRVRNWAKLGLFAPLTRQSHTGRYQVHRALLEEKVWWAAVTNTNDARRWSAAWTGPRMTPRQQVRALRRQSRETRTQES